MFYVILRDLAQADLRARRLPRTRSWMTGWGFNFASFHDIQ